MGCLGGGRGDQDRPRSVSHIGRDFLEEEMLLTKSLLKEALRLVKGDSTSLDFFNSQENIKITESWASIFNEKEKEKITEIKKRKGEIPLLFDPN